MNNYVKIMSNFSDFLTDYIIRKGTNRLTLSKTIGISDSVIARWKNEKALPTFYSLIKLSDYFNVTIDYMLGLSERSEIKRLVPEKTFIEQLTMFMNKKQITAYMLAKRCGFGRAAVSKWFCGYGMPSAEKLVLLAEFFDCSVDFLIGRAE